jgi:hypothetical protein
MLTDIFAYRYKHTSIWQNFGEPERRLLTQAFQIVSEQLYPKKYVDSVTKWTLIHDKLCRELGLSELSPRYYQRLYGQYAHYSIEDVCKNFVIAAYDGSVPADRFMKERISFIELVFRERWEQLKEINANYQHNLMVASAFNKSSELGA